MAPKGHTAEELTTADRKGIFASLLQCMENGDLKHGAFVTVGDKLGVSAKRVSAVCHSVLARMEESVGNDEEDEGAKQFLMMLDGSLPLKESCPDHIFHSGKVGAVGGKRKCDGEALANGTKELPLGERGAHRCLAHGLNISLGHAFAMVNSHGELKCVNSVVEPTLMPTQEHDWSKSACGNVKEQMPDGAPPTRGKRVVLTTYKDANLCHDLATGRAVTGVLHLVNQTPVDWFTKKQATVETAAHGSEFTAARTAIQQITGLRLTLPCPGVEIHGGTHLFGDNKSVAQSGTLPHSPLHKRWHGLACHFTREAAASGVVIFHHMPGEINPADILSEHWGHSQTWEQLQPLLFWRGDTALLPGR